jgi:hypothetical protein
MTISPTGDLSGALAALGVQAGPQVGEEVPIRARTVRIGRGPSNDILLDDDSISGSHARLDWDVNSKAWRITDLGSTNGTYVETVRLAPGVPTPLPFGAGIRFGGVRMYFRDVDDAVAPETAPAVVGSAPSAPARASEPTTPAGRPAGLRTGLIAVGVLIAVALAAVGIQQTVQSRGGVSLRPRAEQTADAEAQAGSAAEQERLRRERALPWPAEWTPPDEPIRIPPPVPNNP